MAAIWRIASSRVVLGPLLNQLAALVKAIYLDATHLYAVSRTRNTEELALVGAAERPAVSYLVPFPY